MGLRKLMLCTNLSHAQIWRYDLSVLLQDLRLSSQVEDWKAQNSFRPSVMLKHGVKCLMLVNFIETVNFVNFDGRDDCCRQCRAIEQIVLLLKHKV